MLASATIKNSNLNIRISIKLFQLLFREDNSMIVASLLRLKLFLISKMIFNEFVLPLEFNFSYIMNRLTNTDGTNFFDSVRPEAIIRTDWMINSKEELIRPNKLRLERTQ